MARPRTFDEDRAVGAAMRAFWASGYAGTSTEDLCAATGLGRSSIYNTFANKRELFEKALRRYMTERTDAAIELLDSELPVRQKVATLLRQATDPDPDDPVGCLVVNSMVELAPTDPEIARRLRADKARRASALRAAIETARRRGELADETDPDTLTSFIIATISGIRVAARGGAGRDELVGIAETALRAL